MAFKINNKTSLNKKINLYSATAGSLILFSTHAHAEIMYTNIDPDCALTLDQDSCNLDLNGDGIIDFKILFSKYSSTYLGTASSSKNISRGVAIIPFNNNSVNVFNDTIVLNTTSGGTSTTNGYFAYALNDNVSINEGLNWENSSAAGLGININEEVDGDLLNNILVGEWIGQTNKYLGLKLEVSGNTYFGWARLDVGDSAQFATVKDYAYETVPNKAIITDSNIQTTLVDNRKPDQTIDIYSENDLLYIVTPKDINLGGTVNIYNLQGQKINSYTLSNSTEIIDIAHIKSGVYIVTLKLEDYFVTKKIVLN